MIYFRFDLLECWERRNRGTLACGAEIFIPFKGVKMPILILLRVVSFPLGFVPPARMFVCVMRLCVI